MLGIIGGWIGGALAQATNAVVPKFSVMALVILVVVTLLVAVDPQTPSASAIGHQSTGVVAPGSTSSCIGEQESNNSRGPRCINGSTLRARGYNSCLDVGKGLEPAVYRPNECYGANSDNDYIEAIAQARFVQSLNPAHAGTVGSHVQWEISLTLEVLSSMSGLGKQDFIQTLAARTGDPVSVLDRGYRPDVLVVGAETDPASNQMYVLEVKGKNGSKEEAHQQATRYVEALRLAGWAGARLVELPGYQDSFHVVRRCRTAAGDTYPTQEVYKAYQPKVGVLYVEVTEDAECGFGDRLEKYPNGTDVASLPNVVVPSIPIPMTSNKEVREIVDGALPIDERPVLPLHGVRGLVKYGTERLAELRLVKEAEMFHRENTDRSTRVALRAGLRQAAFESFRDSICIGPVNALTRGPGQGSVSTTALACRQVRTVIDLVTLLDGIGLKLSAEELAALALPEQELLAMGLGESPAQVRADPRLVTLDGLNYDFHGVGEYTLLRHDASRLEIQMRTIPAGQDMSSVGSLVVRTGDKILEFASTGGLLDNGTPLEVAEGEVLYLGDGVLVSRLKGEIQLLTAFDDSAQQALVGWSPQPGARGDFRLGLPRSWNGEVAGMLGNFDGNPQNDLISASGIDVTGSLKFGVSDSLYLQRLYGTFGDSWRTTDSTSLFTYPDGKQSADYVDRSYPSNVSNLADLSESEFASAVAICNAAGLTEGLGFDDCVLDVGFSGDASFAASLANTRTFGISLGDAHLQDEPLIVAFNAEIPPNFFPATVRSAATNRNYAGPYSAGNHYSFYLNDLPSHSTFRLRARVMVDSLVNVEAPVELLLDDIAVPGQLVAESGVEVALADGASVASVEVTFEVAHSKRDVVGQMRLVAGTAASWVGIERLEVDVERVPFERFDITLESGREFNPAVMVPNSGAGVLEAAGSADRYCFELTGGSALVIDGSKIQHSLGWKLSSADGLFPDQIRRSGSTSTALLKDLSGPACLEVWADTAVPPNLWRYDLPILLVPSADVFAWDVADVRRVSLRGLGLAAGRLESSASVDEYRFTVPAGGLKVWMNWLSSPGGMYDSRAALSLRGPAGVVWSVADVVGTYPTMEEFLPAGDYVFRVAGLPMLSSGTLKGAYDFLLYADSPALTQTFPVDLSVAGVERVLRNTPATPGAGLLETGASVDRFTFSVAAGSDVVLSLVPDWPHGSATKWSLADGAGTKVDGGVLSSTVSKVLSDLSGDYVLTVSRNLARSEPHWTYGQTLKFQVVPAADSFAWDLADIRDVRSRGLGSAAGNLESSASVDEYRFTVPAGGQKVWMNWMMSPGSSFDSGAALSLQGPSGEVWSVANASSNYPTMEKVLPAGEYTFRVSGLATQPHGTLRGVYSFLLYADDSPALTQTFPVDLSVAGVERVLTNSAATPGAATLETSESVDRYTFTVAAGSDLLLSLRGALEQYAPTVWSLADGSGARIDGGVMSAPVLKTIPGLSGDYVLTVSRNPAMTRVGMRATDWRSAPTPTFMVVPSVEVFAWDLADVRRVGARGLGVSAGRLESSASVDEYRFTVPAGGQRVVMNWLRSLSTSVYEEVHLAVSLQGPGGEVWSIPDVMVSYPTRAAVLPAGEYTFRVSGMPHQPRGTLKGTYDFLLYADTPALTQTFPVDLSIAGVQRTVSNSAATPGAGLLETSESVDKYTFTVAAGSDLVLDMGAVWATPAPTVWSLTNATGTQVDGGPLTGSVVRTFAGLSGDHTLTISRNTQVTGAAWGATDWMHGQTLKFQVVPSAGSPVTTPPR